jgi:hypothetical protein
MVMMTRTVQSSPRFERLRQARLGVRRQTWRIQLNDAGAHAICEAPSASVTFDRDCFAADPRIASLRWERGTGAWPKPRS